MCWQELARLAGEVQHLVTSNGLKGVSCALPIPLLPVMVTEGRGWGGGKEHS